MRARGMPAIAAASVLFWAGAAWAEGAGRCPLDGLIGYTLAFSKPVVARIENGRREKGYEGCQPDRVLIFGDNTGLRCREVSLHHLDDPPNAYIFVKGAGDIKLCVEGDVFSVAPTN